MTTAPDYLAALRSHVGYREEPPGSNCNRFSHALGRPCESWCLDYLLSVAKDVGLDLPDGVEQTAYTPTAQAAFQKAGRFGVIPLVGAFTFWDFPDNVDRTQHVSVVVTWDIYTVTTLDGNTSLGAHGSQANGEWVAIRTRPRSYVVGFGHPVYTGVAPAPAPPSGWVGPPQHFPEDDMDRIPLSIPVKKGRGYLDVDVDVNSIVSIVPFGGDPSDGWDVSPVVDDLYARGLKPGRSRIVLPKSGIDSGTVAVAVWAAR